jgi:uncharacterized protein (DUF427 family)
LKEEGRVPRATWNGKVIAESDDTKVVEGNHYFPPDAINHEYLKPSATVSHCPWKGIASYYHVDVDGSVNSDAAWYYPETKEAAQNIKGHVAFWKGVTIEE